MAVPLGKGTHRLRHVDPQSSSKSVILVKLTDAALKAIEQYARRQNQPNCTSTSRATIQLIENTGAIVIPIDEDGRHIKFSFTRSSLDDMLGKGGLECYQSTPNRTLEPLGAIREKIQVHASDDTYTRFGEKMVEVKKENEKRTTVFIDRPGGAKAQFNRAQQFVRKPVMNPVSRINHKESTRVEQSLKPATSAPPTKTMSPRYQSPSDPARNESSLERSQLSKPTAASQKHLHHNTEIMKRPLRERIVHLLAMRPFKKPELVSRIVKDGLREKDRNSITVILKQVSMIKDNTYHLLRHIWNDVSEDWPFYTDDERQSFRRRKPQNLTPPGSDGSSGSSIVSGHSSTSSHPASPKASTTLKRGPNINRDRFYDGTSDFSGPAAKKKRVSNYIRPPDLRVSPADYSRNKSPLLMHSPNRGRQSPYNDHRINDGKVSGWLMANSNSAARSSPTPSKLTSEPASHQSPSPDEPSRAELLPRIDITPDYLKKFTRIDNDLQRQKFKEEFNRDHQLYRDHHNYLESKSKEFERLEYQLRQSAEGSDYQKQLKARIIAEYHNNKRTRQEFEYLHHKLAHIKMLVHDYDRRMIGEEN